ncbi:glyoxalase [Rhodococcus sp. IEGM 1330]|uniref:glyoxalase n=1 Tax=Rhodococcus sp. IEGM 1330 TaxID=3082225 RepID=UPI002955BA9F|nr:glyoxalase [Rhodococcus sp. IEGM 1330]MDV8022029.1 glyoxalase [Rhodococcus sp. IEGM 1330]
MTFSLDSIQLGSSDPQRARAFYASALQASDVVRVGDFDEKPSGYQGYTVSYIVEQPTEVRSVLAAAEQAGATVVKPAKKMLFGAFSGVFLAPDGSFWKVAAPTKKDTGPALDSPKPTEIAVLLGVSEPKASKKFYEALGMTTDRDYGNKYIDFAPAHSACRLGLMTVDALAKDSGAEKGSVGARNVVLEYRTASRDEADTILRTAESAGGQAVSDSRFTDPDGYVWSVVTS